MKVNFYVAKPLFICPRNAFVGKNRIASKHLQNLIHGKVSFNSPFELRIDNQYAIHMAPKRGKRECRCNNSRQIDKRNPRRTLPHCRSIASEEHPHCTVLLLMI